MKKITKRDILFFILGVFSLFLLESIYDWEGTVKAFNDGYEDGRKSTLLKVE